MNKIYRALFFFLISSLVFAKEPSQKNLWHPLFKDEMLSVDAERSLYRSPGNGKSLALAIRVTNNSAKPIGLDLRKDATIYPNQWELSIQPQRSVIDERRMIVEPMSALAKKILLEDYDNRRLLMIPPRTSMAYFSTFNNYGPADSEMKKAKYLIVTVDGQVRATDGKNIKQLFFNIRDEGDEREISIPLPTVSKQVPQKELDKNGIPLQRGE